MNIRSLRSVTALAAISLFAAACGSSETPAASSSETVVVDTSAPSTGGGTLIYVTPNPIGTNAFLQLGKAGTEQAAAAMGGDFKVFESSDPTTIRQNVEAAIAEKPTVVIVIGFEFADVLAELAPANPDQQFLLVDQCIDSPPVNLTCAVFREYEGTFLLGAE
ncbi:MAG: BMP family ABC transporter substrate-binding protein, partial [Ilumatobacteraceae bacterium]